MEESYLYHKYAVVVVRAGEIVGHVPRSMSKASFFFGKIIVKYPVKLLGDNKKAMDWKFLVLILL